MQELTRKLLFHQEVYYRNNTTSIFCYTISGVDYHLNLTVQHLSKYLFIYNLLFIVLISQGRFCNCFISLEICYHSKKSDSKRCFAWISYIRKGLLSSSLKLNTEKRGNDNKSKTNQVINTAIL